MENFEGRKEYRIAGFYVDIWRSAYNKIDVQVKGCNPSRRAVVADSEVLYVGANEFATLKMALDFAVQQTIAAANNEAIEKEKRKRICDFLDEGLEEYDYSGGYDVQRSN